MRANTALSWAIISAEKSVELVLDAVGAVATWGFSVAEVCG